MGVGSAAARRDWAWVAVSWSYRWRGGMGVVEP